jgi:hypothetical protein
MKAYGGVDVQTHVFLTSGLDGGEWSLLRPGRFSPGERAQSQSGRHGELKILDPTGTRTPTLRSTSQ